MPKRTSRIVAKHSEISTALKEAYYEADPEYVISHFFTFYTDRMSGIIPIKYILCNSHLPWNWNFVSINPGVTKEIVKKYSNLPWNKRILRRLTFNSGKGSTPYFDEMVIALISANPDGNWDWDVFSMNKHISIDLVKSLRNKLWNWAFLTENTGIGISDIFDNPDLPWVYSSLSTRVDITPDDIENNPQVKWHYGFLSYCPKLTWEFISANSDKPWNYRAMRHNPHITCEIMLANPEINWGFHPVLKNPNILLDLIRNGDKLEGLIDYGFIIDIPEKEYWVWNYGKNWRWMTKKERREIILLRIIAMKYYLPDEIFHMIAEFVFP
jgi:hypothetical protein